MRPYQPGDDVRAIDWNVTARTGEPHVRVHVAERSLVAWLVLDVSPSMSFGTADRRKADVAEGVALALGYLATRSGNRLGVVTFGGSSPALLPPRRGREALLTTLLQLRTAPDEEGTGVTPLGPALARAAAAARRRGLVAIVGDFRGPDDWAAPLRASRRATTSSRSRSATRASRSSRTSATSPSSTPRPGRGCVSTRAAAACASASPPRPPTSGPGSSARSARPASTTSSSRRRATGCAPSSARFAPAEAGGERRDLPLAGRPARARARAARAARVPAAAAPARQVHRPLHQSRPPRERRAAAARHAPAPARAARPVGADGARARRGAAAGGDQGAEAPGDARPGDGHLRVDDRRRRRADTARGRTRGGADAARVASRPVPRRRRRVRAVRRDDLPRARRQGRRARGDRQHPPRGRDGARRSDRPGADDGSRGHGEREDVEGARAAVRRHRPLRRREHHRPRPDQRRGAREGGGHPRLHRGARDGVRDGRDHRRVRPDARRPRAARQGDAPDDRRDHGRKDLRGPDRGAAPQRLRGGRDARRLRRAAARADRRVHRGRRVLLLLGAALSALWFNRIP